MNNDQEQELLDEYTYLQWHKNWLKEERDKADKRQYEIKKLLSE